MLLLLRRFIAATTLFGYVLNFLGLPQFCFAMDSEELPTKRSHSLMVSGPLSPQGIHFVSAASSLPQRPTKEELYTLLKTVPPHFARTSLTQLPQVPWSLPDTFLSMIWTDFTGSQECLTLPKGYNYATLQGQKYVSDALFSSTKEGAQWTCVLDKKSLFFDYKPSQQGETTLSFTLTIFQDTFSQYALRITKMKTREAQIEFGGNTFFDWQEAVNGPSHALKVASLNIINESFLTSQTVKIYANQYKNQGRSEAKEAFFLVGHLINTGQVLRAQQLKIQSNIIDNEGGHLLGQDVNEVEISQKLNNKGGEISSEGQMSLSFPYDFDTVKDAGTIRGMEISILKDLKKLPNGFYTSLNFKTGTLQGTQKVTLQIPFFKGEQLNIITPLCVMQAKGFFLSPQTQCGRFVLSLNASQNFTLKNPFATKGSFEIWQEGLKTQEDVDKAMEERFQERKQAPVLESKIHLKNNLQARFLRIFMPSAKVILGEEGGPLLDILMEEGDVDIAVTSFDLQKATFATQTVSIYAPDGIRLGRLETDPEKKVFVPFCWHGQQAHSPNLGNYISSVFYDFRGQRLTDTYDGHVLSRLPVVRGNGSSFSIQNTATLRGPLTQEAMFVAKDLSLSSKTALFEGSVTRIHNNFIFNEDCTLTVQPATGVFNFTYRNTKGTYFKYATQSFVNSEGATLRVEGRLLSRHPVTLINKASTLYAGNKSPLVVVQDQILKSDLFQKTFEGRAELDRLTTQPCANQYRIVSGCSNRVAGSLIAAKIFLEKTNNFAGAVNTFMPTTTFREGVIFGTHEAIPLNLSSPLAIVLIGQEGRVIGLENPHVVTSQSPFADLMEKPLDFGTTRLNIFLKDFSSKPSHFKFQERFWFDDENAQRFYESIREDIILFSPEGIFQRLDNPFLTLSPKILLARIQEAVQKKLGRGYIDHGKPIDEAYACELHRNATEHLRSLPGCILKATGLTLLRQDAVNIPLSQKPLIYYKKVVDETGGTSLSPEMSFPAHLLNPMGTVRNTKIHVGTLLAISEGMTLKEAQKCFEGKVAQQAILSTILQERPTLLALLEAPEGPNALALKGGPDALALKGENQLALKVSHGPLALHGDFETDTLMVLSAGKLTCHGDTRINTIHALLASLFDDVEAKSWVERISHSNGYEDVLKGCFEIVAEGALCISAGRDLTLVAAHTRSKLGTYFQAARDSFDLPAVLQSHFSSTSGSKKKKRTETRDVSLPVASQHTSEGAFLSSAGRHNIHQGNSITAKNIVEHGGESHQQIPAYKSVSASSTSSQKGFLGGKKSSQSSETRIQSIPCERLSENTVTHLSPRQCLVGSTITAKGQVSLLTLDGLGEIQFRVRRDTTQRSTSSSSSSDWWGTQKQSGDGVSIPHSVVINSPFPIKVSASFIKVEESDGSPSLRDKIDTQAQIESLLAQIETQSCHTSHSGPTALTAGLVALTIAIATQYWGTELMEAVITSQAVAAGSTTAAVVAGSTAAMGSLLGTLGATLLNTKGNISASLKQTIHPDSLKGALAVGLTTGLCYELIPSQEVLKSASKSATAAAPEATSYFFPHARQAALQVPIETGVHTSLGTKKMGDAFRGAALNGVAQTAHRGAANALGANASKLGTFGHKLGHLGAATTAAHISSKGKDFKISLINGANAVLGEMIMEATVDRALEVEALKKAHPDLSPQELNQRFQDQTAHRKHLAIWTSGALGGICGGDVGTSASLAGTSIEHNFMSTSKELFLEDPEEETQAKESFWGRSASQGEKGASKKTSLFGAKEEKKAKAGLGGASARPDTQREYAKALDPKGAVAKSIGKPYEMRNPVHVSFSEAFTPKWHSEVKASVQNFNRFLVETEPRRSLQRVERTGEDFKGKAQALSKEKLDERPRSNSASEREMAAYFWSLTEHQEGEVQAAEAAEIRHLEAEERVAQTAHAHEEATGWERLRTASEWRDAEDIALLTGFDYSWTVPNKSLLEARKAFQERNKPLLATINQSIQKTETFHKQNPHCPMTPEERQDLFDLYETREFVATAHFHIPVNVKQGIGTGILIGTTFMPLGKFVAEGPRQVAKAFSATSKMIRAAEVHATRMLNLQKGKSALLKIPGMPFKKKEITSHFGSVVQELKAEFVHGTQKSATLEALNLETSQSPFVDKVTFFEQKHGKIAIQNMSTGEFAQSLANRADRKFLGNGPEVGKQKHRYAKEVGLRYQKMTGDKRQLMFERRFIENEEWKKGDGLKGSVIPDVYAPRTHEVFDYKFGKAHLGTRQITNTTAVMPKLGEEQLVAKMTEVKPTLKTEQTK